MADIRLVQTPVFEFQWRAVTVKMIIWVENYLELHSGLVPWPLPKSAGVFKCFNRDEE